MNIYTRCACVKFDYCLLVRCFSFFLSFVFGAYVLPRWLFAGSLLQMDAYFSSLNCDIESVNSLVAGRQQLSSPRQRLCSLGALLGRSRLNDRCCKLVQIPSVGGGGGAGIIPQKCFIAEIAKQGILCHPLSLGKYRPPGHPWILKCSY